ILLNVEGEIVSTGSLLPIQISGNTSDGGGPGSGESNLSREEIARINAEKNGITQNVSNNQIEEENKEKNIEDNKESKKENFDITFEIPFQNNGNIHIKPTGKIVLKDEDGKELKGIGKEVITNDDGVVIGEKIVDYIPINDEDGNVLPYTVRKFEPQWKGFPYKDYDEDGNLVIKYWDPSTYYTKKNVEERGFLFPWEKVAERTQDKTITALVDVVYENYEGENIEFNSAEEFQVSYTEKYLAVNMLVVGGIAGTLALIILSSSIWYIAKPRCIRCGRKIGRSMVVCPYCGKKQKKKKK
ncbi:hypothetical protein MK079_05270, partial [Candidatus Gracilibacteria bacterium]|nr:hypothetical protein [Candidatus Gracilibacteria bacterium]